ncbi:unnamed protein product [Albugo candida]|uniref:HORMA domain-containing protein n=1 Tax=Albugo candida TaxID=65357 RepID=A0A024GBW0_9STRA|nr:unnamed protein product [Albugo candida]|eukprot:CCI44159.1 unnamed protein product [Albugo candida]
MQPKKSKDNNKNATEFTYIQSLNVIRNMIRVSISEVCHLRSVHSLRVYEEALYDFVFLSDLFSAKLFRERIYADMRVKCLAPRAECGTVDAKDALMLTQWLEEGVFEALEKKYLESLIFCIHSLKEENEPGQLLESYTYTIQQDEHGDTLLSTDFNGLGTLHCSTDDVKAQAIQMIRTLVKIVNTLSPLPECRMLTMRVSLNALCPTGWQPKYFRASSDVTDATNLVQLPVGKLKTPFHLVSLILDTTEHEKVNKPRVSENTSRRKNSCVTPVTKSQSSQEYSSLSQDINKEMACTDGSDSDLDPSFEKTCTSRPAKSNPRKPSQHQILTEIMKSSIVTVQSLQSIFPNVSEASFSVDIENFCKDGVLKDLSDGTFGVLAQDNALLNRAIDLTHGRLKRNGVTVETVSSQLGVTGTLASAILIRMEKQRLVALIPNSLTSYKVRFTAENRTLIENAILHATKQSTARTLQTIWQTPNKIRSVPLHPSTGKPRRQTNSSKTEVTSRVSQSCSKLPIFQTRKALKRRRLASETPSIKQYT